MLFLQNKNIIITRMHCSNQGRCRGLNGDCICDAGFSGHDCNTTKVVCADGFAGPDCQACEEGTYGIGCKDECDPRTHCSNQGRCRGLNGDCICDEGFSGSYCNATKVVCADGFAGPNCQACEEGTYGIGCKEECDLR